MIKIEDTQLIETIEAMGKTNAGLFKKANCDEFFELFTELETIIIVWIASTEDTLEWFVGKFGDVTVKQVENILVWTYFDALEAEMMAKIATIMAKQTEAA